MVTINDNHILLKIITTSKLEFKSLLIILIMVTEYSYHIIN